MNFDKPQKLGPGLLKFGETGSDREFSTMTSSTAINPELKKEDPIDMLDGSAFVTSEPSWGGNVEGNIQQGYHKDSLLKWTWDHAGKIVPFTFIPRNDEAMKITGKVSIDPLKIGGDVKKNNTSDFSFTLTEKPVITDDNGPAQSNAAQSSGEAA